MPSQKSLLFISPSANHSGAEEALIGYMEAALQSNYRPVLVLPNEGWLSEKCKEKRIEYEVVNTIPRPFTYDKWQHLRTWFWNAYRIQKLTHKWNAVAIHSNTSRAAFHGGLGSRMAGVPSIAHVHELIKLPYESKLMALLLRNLVDLTICVSHAVEKKLISLAPYLKGKTKTLYNGTSSDIYNFDVPSNIRKELNIDENTMLFGVVSSLIPMKGQDLLIAAFREVQPVVKNIKLIIVGGVVDGVPEHQQYADMLRSMVYQSNLEKQVLFTGWREDAIKYIQAMDIFAFTPNLPDSLPTVLIHASGLAKPIIACRIGGIPEIITHQKNGILIDVNNKTQLVEAMITLASNPEMRLSFGVQARKQYDRLFTFDVMKTELGSIYNEITCFRSVKK